MSELQPPVEAQINSGGEGVLVAVPTETVVAPTKRQRRPSVRLGDIGDQQTYDNHRRTKQQQWRYPSKDSNTSKTRPLVNLTGGSGGGAIAAEYQETLDGGQDKDGGNNNYHHNINNSCNNNNTTLDTVAIGSWKVRDSAKSKRGFSTTKRGRSNWVPKMDEGEGKFSVGDDEFGDDDDDDDEDGFRDYDRDGSDSQLKEQSLNLSLDNERDLHHHGVNRGRDGVRARVYVKNCFLGEHWPESVPLCGIIEIGMKFRSGNILFTVKRRPNFISGGGRRWQMAALRWPAMGLRRRILGLVLRGQCATFPKSLNGSC